MKKALIPTLATTAIAVTASLVLAAPASAAQGGWDRNGDPHAWIKIGRAEMNKAANYPQKNCWSALFANEGKQNRFIACDNLVPGLMAEQTHRPNANGYWAEYYYKNGRIRSGSW
ncbi:hypothetical protein [[Mycobacterium] zoologicum]|uniref:hypothetical protein n=1 Tax=[Mycobacterium] zoologicum TaxID=2872311 RepID=UPI001CDADD7A|nr:hypothetical protein [Mycolicibacter sp. MYC101]MEB3061667.1 hypothetical protein [Mycolicibacter sp. MYC101]